MPVWASVNCPCFGSNPCISLNDHDPGKLWVWGGGQGVLSKTARAKTQDLGTRVPADCYIFGE